MFLVIEIGKREKANNNQIIHQKNCPVSIMQIKAQSLSHDQFGTAIFFMVIDKRFSCVSILVTKPLSN